MRQRVDNLSRLVNFRNGVAVAASEDGFGGGFGGVLGGCLEGASRGGFEGVLGGGGGMRLYPRETDEQNFTNF